MELLTEYIDRNEVVRIYRQDGKHVVVRFHSRSGGGFAYSIDRTPQTFTTLAAAQAEAAGVAQSLFDLG